MANGNKNNIDKALEALSGALEIEPVGEEVQVGPEGGPDPNIELMEDGGANINMDPNAPVDTSNIPHDANLADFIQEEELSRFSADLLGEFESDKDSRKDWTFNASSRRSGKEGSTVHELSDYRYHDGIRS